MSQAVSRIIYPRFPNNLTDDDWVRLFTVSYEDEMWGFTIARRGPSLVMLVIHLKGIPASRRIPCHHGLTTRRDQSHR